LPRTPSSSSRAPASAARFRVDWGGPEGSEGFLGVVFEPFPTEGGGELRLTRAVTGDRGLLDWLQMPPPRVPARPVRIIDGVRPRRPLALGRVRTVSVTLLDARSEPVARYDFEGASPVSLALSPLDAVAGGLLTETLTLAFAKVTMR
jgi:hypothetical protein